MKKTLIGLATASALFSGSAFAAPVITNWSALVDATFDTTTIVSSIGAAPGVTGINVANGNRSLFWGPGAAPVSPTNSGLDIGFSPINAPAITNGAVAPTISVTHRNNALATTFPTLKSVVIDTSFALTATNPLNIPFPTQVFSNKIHFTETINAGVGGGLCVDGTSLAGDSFNSNGCADIFVIDDVAALTQNFSLLGEDYVLKISELSGNLIALSNGACTAAGQAAGCVGFRTKEGRDTTFRFGYQITHKNNVPEPESLALVALGLFGAAVASRKRKAA